MQPMAATVPRLLCSNGAALLLADPTSRTKQHRQQFVELLGRGKQGMRLAMQVVLLCSAAWCGGRALPAMLGMRLAVLVQPETLCG